MKSSGPSSIPPGPGDDAIEVAAARWAERRAAGLTAADRDAFRAWLKADPRHPAAFAQANPEGDELDWPLHTGLLDDVLAGLEQRAQRRKRRRVAAVALSATALVAVALFLPSRRQAINPVVAETRATPSRLVVVSAQRQTLPDGSVVELKEGASIRLAYSDAFRRVTLEQGEAHFQVAKNPARPFIVTAGTAEVRAVGTAFFVQVEPAHAELIVTEGRVAVTSTISPDVSKPASAAKASEPVATEVDVGHRALIDLRSAEARPVVRPLAMAEMDERMTWRVPRLEFAGTPLSEVVAMLNHYAETRQHHTRIVLAPDVANLRVSGALRADKVDALIAMLESDFPVTAERHDDGTITLRRRS